MKLSPMRIFTISALCLTVLIAGCYKQPPEWATGLVSNKRDCVEAALDAKQRAIAIGITEDRMQWIIGNKPYASERHMSLVIDKWIVVDNGGLGVNAWGDTICPGNVCTLEEAERGLVHTIVIPSDSYAY